MGRSSDIDPFCSEQGTAQAGRQDSDSDAPLSAPVTPMTGTNQAERAAMQPEGHDIEWPYYHGAWSG